MRSIILLMALAAAPFWEAKPPRQWTDQQLQQIFVDSPWAQTISPPPQAQGVPVVPAYIASAMPMQQAEAERERRARARSTKPVPEDPLAEEYKAYVRENQGKQIILAIPYLYGTALSDEQEIQRMQEGCVMRIGRKKFKLTGHFPPSSTDHYLRLVFPREVDPKAKTIVFDLYLPGVPAPYRSVEFSLKSMVYNGKLEL